MNKLLRLALFAAALKAVYALVQKRRSANARPAGAPFAPATVPDKTTEPEPALAGRAAAPADDLTAVKGIGPVYARKLDELDISDFEALAAADTASLAAALSVAESTISDWQEQAGELRS